MDMDIFRENNTTYADLQVILLLALKGDFYLSDKTAYVQTFHNSNASMVFTDAAKAVVNLNFAEIPFAAALEARAFEEKELNSWLDNIVKPFVFLTMKNLYEKDRPGYEKYLMQIRVKYPAVYSEISNSRKWKLMKLIYSNRVTGFLFNQILKIRNAGK